MRRREFLAGIAALPVFKALSGGLGGRWGRISQVNSSRVRDPIHTGYSKIDEIAGGFYPGELVIIASRPSMGKSALAINIANNLSGRHGLRIAYFSLEMSRSTLNKRLFALNSISGEAKSLDTNLLIFDNWAVDPHFISEKLIELAEHQRPHLIIIDYFQLMTANGGVQARKADFGDIAMELKALATKLETPVLVLSQLNRGPEARRDRRPRLTDLRGAAKIVESADLVMMLYRDDYYRDRGESLDNRMEIDIAVNRRGGLGRANLAWNPSSGMIENI